MVSISFTFKRWQFSILLYILTVFLIVTLRPALFFDAEGRAKTFGIGITENVSMFAPAFLFPFLGIFFYYVAVVIEAIGV
jgi:hypothetical protein